MRIASARLVRTEIHQQTQVGQHVLAANGALITVAVELRAFEQIDAKARVGFIRTPQGAGHAAVEQIGADFDELARFAPTIRATVVGAAENIGGYGHRRAVALAAAQAGFAAGDDKLAGY